MDKTISKLTGELSYFLGNILVEVKVAFLLNCPLVLSLLKYKGVRTFFELNNEESKQRKPLK